DADGIELLDRLDGLQRGHVALGPRADRVAAVAALEGAGATGRVFVEDERLARARVRAADVAVVAAALEIAGHLAVKGLGERAHHRRLDAILHLDHAAARRRGIGVYDGAGRCDDGAGT